jgi:hypothetical protein
VGEGDERLPQRPAAAARPGGLVHFESGPEGLSTLRRTASTRWRDRTRGRPRPSTRSRARPGAARARRAGWTAPRRRGPTPVGRARGRRGRLPTPGGRVDRRSPRQGLDGVAGLAVPPGERAAPEKLCNPGRRTMRRVDPVHRGQEVGELDRDHAQVGDPLDRGRFALEPPVHRSRPRELQVGFPFRPRLGDGQRQPTGEDRQPRRGPPTAGTDRPPPGRRAPA